MYLRVTALCRRLGSFLRQRRMCIGIDDWRCPLAIVLAHYRKLNSDLCCRRSWCTSSHYWPRHDAAYHRGRVNGNDKAKYALRSGRRRLSIACHCLLESVTLTMMMYAAVGDVAGKYV